MSITRAQRLRLGIFMVTGIAILVILIAIPLGLRLRDSQKTYVTYFAGESLSGLEEGATVKFRGVPIGKVSDISYSSENLEQVKATLMVENDFPMKTDMFAQVGAMGITGLKYVEIMGGSNDAPLLKAPARIPTKTSVIATITGRAEVLTAKIELLLTQINKITHPDSLHEIKQILENVSAITGDTRIMTGAAAPALDTITGSVVEFSDNITKISRNIDALTSDLRANLSGNEIPQTVARIDSAAYALQQLTETISLIFRQSREDFTVAMENFREAAENANELSRLLSENPSLLLRGDQQKRRSIR